MIALLAAAAAAAYQSSPPRTPAVERSYNHWLADYRAGLMPRLMQDFGEKYLYAPADRALAPPQPGERRVIFIGDSITDRWDLARSFPGRPYVNRGIGGQVTAQLVLRFHQDVIALKPAAVVILAGINDLNGVLQLEGDDGIEANWEAMAEMAIAHGIVPVFATLMPVNNYTANARDMLVERDPRRIRRLNAWLAAFCRAHNYPIADVYAATVDRAGLLAREITDDGIHPLANGYARMAPILDRAIETALARRSR